MSIIPIFAPAAYPVENRVTGARRQCQQYRDCSGRNGRTPVDDGVFAKKDDFTGSSGLRLVRPDYGRGKRKDIIQDDVGAVLISWSASSLLELALT